VFPARYELNSYIVFRKRLVSKRLSSLASCLLHESAIHTRVTMKSTFVCNLVKRDIYLQRLRTCTVNKQASSDLSLLFNRDDGSSKLFRSTVNPISNYTVSALKTINQIWVCGFEVLMAASTKFVLFSDITACRLVNC
jgi:hypothetical protein